MQQIIPVKKFIRDLADDNARYFANLSEQDTTYWPKKLTGRASAEALKPRWFNELRGVEVIGRFIERVPDLSLKMLVGRQVGDEAKHARICRKRIEALGSTVLDFEPTPAQVSFGDMLDGFAYPEEFFAAQQFTVETQSIVRNEKALSRFDSTTADLFRRHINPDERFHARLGVLGLQVFARTAVAQERARRAVIMIRDVHVEMVRQHMSRMQEGGWLN